MYLKQIHKTKPKTNYVFKQCVYIYIYIPMSTTAVVYAALNKNQEY